MSLINEKMNSHIIFLVLSILLALPSQKFYYIGNDSYEILWMAKALFKISRDHTWLISISSYFGYYPFSHYPIGYPLFLGLILQMNSSLYFLIMVNSLTVISIGYFSFYKLSSLYFTNKEAMISSFIYINTPLFIRFHYMTTNARGPFLSFLPLYLYFLIHGKMNKNKTDFFGLIGTFFILSLIHRLSIILIAFGVIILISSYVSSYISSFNTENIANNVKYKTIAVLIILVTYISLIMFSLYVFGIDSRKIYSPWFSNSTPFGLAINLIIDLGLRFGLISVFAIFGFFSILNEIFAKKNKKKSTKNVFLLLSTLLFTASSTLTLYSTIVFLPIIVLIGMYSISISHTLYFIQTNIFKISVGIFTLTFFTLYTYLYTNTIFEFLLYFGVIIVFFSIIHLLKYFGKASKAFLTHKNTYFIIVLISFSIFINQNTIQTSINKEDGTITTDEVLKLTELIKDNIDSRSVIFCSSTTIARTFGAIGFFPAIYGNHAPHQLYYNFISSETVDSNTKFSSAGIRALTYYDYVLNDPEMEIFNEINNLKLDNNITLQLVKEVYKVQFVVTQIKKGTIINYIENRYGERTSPLINSLINSSNYLYFKGKEYIAWKLY